MQDVASRLIETLGGKTVSFPELQGLSIPEFMITSWGIMAFIMIMTLIFTHNLKIVPGKSQIALEGIYNFIHGFLSDILGKEGERYIPFLGTVLIYLAVSNTIGLFGLTPPTKDLNVTAGLAFMSIILVEYSGLHQKGLRGYFKSFAHPMPAMLPFNILEIFIRPLSLCMRLFGNIFGGFVIMELIRLIVPVIVPLPFGFYFDVFDGLLQAYVFVFLTSLFMQEKIDE